MMASLTRACGKGRPLELRPQLLQNPDDLFFRKPFALHALVLVLGQSELQTGLSPSGKVKEGRLECDPCLSALFVFPLTASFPRFGTTSTELPTQKLPYRLTARAQ